MASPSLQIRALGELELRAGERRLPSLESARAESLLAYLLLHRGTRVPRRRLAFLLWPDSAEPQARTNLRHLLHTVRRTLPVLEACIDVTPRTLEWRTDARFWLDVAAFEAALGPPDRVTNAPSGGLSGRAGARNTAKGASMATTCKAFPTEEEARAEVDRLLATGMSGDEIRVLMGEPVRDRSEAPVGSFAGEAGAVGSFADHPHAAGDGMGTFAGDASEQRTGGFGDIDRETVTTYENGVKRVHVASHRDLERMLVDAGLDPEVARADVDGLHHGRVLVLTR